MFSTCCVRNAWSVRDDVVALPGDYLTIENSTVASGLERVSDGY